jgi:hypothetical protein
MALTASINVGLDIRRTATPDFGSDAYAHSASWLKALLDGTGVNQANKVFVDKVQLAGAGTVTYDLDSGALADPSGVSGGVVAAFSRIVAICIRRVDAPAAGTQDENVNLLGDFVKSKLLGGWVDDAVVIPIRPGGMFLFVAPDATGVAITAATGDELTLTNASAGDTVNLEVVIIGS